jgi:hypothetical protein
VVVRVLPLFDVVADVRIEESTSTWGTPQGPGTPNAALDLSKLTCRRAPWTTHTDTRPLVTEAEIETESDWHLSGGGLDSEVTGADKVLTEVGLPLAVEPQAAPIRTRARRARMPRHRSEPLHMTDCHTD